MLKLMSTIEPSPRPWWRAVVRSARSAGLSDVLIDVLADPSQPEVARLRAYGTTHCGTGSPGSKPPLRRLSITLSIRQ